MKLRQVAIWLLVLALAAAVYYWLEARDEAQERAKAKAAKIISLKDPLNVKTIELSGRMYPKAVRIERRDKEHRWQMVKPVDYPADGMTVSRLIGTLLDATAKQTIETPKDRKKLASFGLAPPAVKVVFLDRKGGKAELFLGDYTPTGKHVYAMAPKGKKIWLLERPVGFASQRTLVQLRDKTVLDFVVSRVKELKTTLNRQLLQLVRVKGGAQARWRFKDNTEADPEEVSTLLYQLSGLRAKDLLDEGFDLKTTGLAKPRAEVRLTMEKGGRVGLLIGAKVTGRKEVYVRRASGGPVMAVDGMAITRLVRSRKQLTLRRMGKWRLDDVLAAKVHWPKRELAFIKKGGSWRRAPDGDLKSGQPGEMMLRSLEDLKWEKLLPKGDYGLQKPRVVISLTLKPLKGAKAVRKYELRLGKVDPASKLLAAGLKGDKRIFGLEASLLKDIAGYQKPAAKDKTKAKAKAQGKKQEK